MVQPLPNVAGANLKAPNSGDNSQVGSPTIAPAALSQVANTSVAASNSKLTHVCDITGDIRYAVAWASLQIKQLIEAVRNALEKLWGATSSSPFADEVRAVIKAIKAKIKQIQKLIDKAKEVQSVVTDYIQKLQELIAYINSLPDRIAKFLNECLTHAMSSLGDAIKNAKEITTASANTSLKAASSEAESANNASSSSVPTFQKP
jgi:phage-related protein